MSQELATRTEVYRQCRELLHILNSGAAGEYVHFRIANMQYVRDPHGNLLMKWSRLPKAEGQSQSQSGNSKLFRRDI